MKKINYCYHSHTYRCGHAVGHEEDYIKMAIKAKLKNFGVSDHVILPNYVQPGMRGAGTELPGYLSSLKALKIKYKDKINLYAGFECEYMPEFLDYYKELLDTHQVDYLILGQHMYLKNGRVMWYGSMSREDALKTYTEHLIAGMKSGLFKYVAHPDLFMCFTDRWDDLEKECAQAIIDAAIKYHLPLEINLCHAREYGRQEVSGYYSYYEYPFTPFWQMVAKTNIHVVVGFDSHLPEHVLYPGLHIVEDVIKETGVKVDFDYKII